VFDLQVLSIPSSADNFHCPTLQSSSLTRLMSQRNLNNAFAYDLVPSLAVIVAAVRAARRVNDFPTSVRVFEGMNPLHKSSSLS
jgi:hypothetical protein